MFASVPSILLHTFFDNIQTFNSAMHLGFMLLTLLTAPWLT